MKRFIIESLTGQVGWQEGQQARNVTEALERKAESDSGFIRFPLGCFILVREEGKETGGTYERAASGFKRRAPKAVPIREVIATPENRWERWRVAKLKADALGHTAMQQGYCVECSRCDRDGYVPSDEPARGNIFTDECGRY